MGEIPSGEVLLFAGDAVGNYGKSHDISSHFEDFLEWLTVQSCRFRHIFFIAGNHETLLDAWQADASSSLHRLNQFLDKVGNCTYLNNNRAVYRGLQLFGSPITVSRIETEGKRYYSRAFERMSEQRVLTWSWLPEGLDVLMTHCPPQGRLCSPDTGDPLLSTRLAQLQHPPKFHIFVHDHLHFGIASDEQTIYMNVAQDTSALDLLPAGPLDRDTVDVGANYERIFTDSFGSTSLAPEAPLTLPAPFRGQRDEGTQKANSEPTSSDSRWDAVDMDAMKSMDFR